MTESNIVQHKKRGRKPKNYVNTNIISNICSTIHENINSEEEKVIYHLPLNPNDINDTQVNNLFIKNNLANKVNCNNNSIVNDDNLLSVSGSDFINSTIINNNNNINKIIIHQINFNKNTKCWWCKNNFSTPAIQLPESYSDGIFYCTGNFCSYNCAKSYNLDLNDVSTYKRNSLINFLYNLTYSENNNIISAPHWLSLEEYGGILTIEQFRENFIINNKEYIVLHPPIISRQMQIEESYKISKLKEVSINKLNKIYSDIDSEYTIKRNKSYQSNNLSLEETMGFIKKDN
jgi:hypothetical protein